MFTSPATIVFNYIRASTLSAFLHNRTHLLLTLFKRVLMDWQTMLRKS